MVDTNKKPHLKRIKLAGTMYWVARYREHTYVAFTPEGVLEKVAACNYLYRHEWGGCL